MVSARPSALKKKCSHQYKAVATNCIHPSHYQTFGSDQSSKFSIYLTSAASFRHEGTHIGKEGRIAQASKSVYAQRVTGIRVFLLVLASLGKAVCKHLVMKR